MTDDQIIAPLSKSRRAVGALAGICGAWLVSRLPVNRDTFLALLGIIGIGYFVYIATLVRIWNARYRIERNPDLHGKSHC
jgi:hypothetical protein